MHMNNCFFQEAARIDNSCAMAYWDRRWPRAPGIIRHMGMLWARGARFIKQMNDAAANLRQKKGIDRRYAKALQYR